MREYYRQPRGAIWGNSAQGNRPRIVVVSSSEPPRPRSRVDRHSPRRLNRQQPKSSVMTKTPPSRRTVALRAIAP